MKIPNKNYNSGRNFEYRTKKYLEQKGYYVMRSAGSKTAFDLIAIPMVDNLPLWSHTLLIQCKHGTSISKATKQTLKDFQENVFHHVSCLIAWSKKGGQIEFYAWQINIFACIKTRTFEKIRWLD